MPRLPRPFPRVLKSGGARARITLCPLRLGRILQYSLALLFAGAFTAFGDAKSDRMSVILVIGAPGEPEYASNFLQQATLWENACKQANCLETTIGLEDVPNATNDFERLQQTLQIEPKDGASQLWLVLVGHGTFDGKEARFNLRGPDVSASELAGWLRAFRRPLAVVDTSSSSAPFLKALSGTNRVIITGTRSGNEQNFARFGQYFAEAITGTKADLDKDGQVSLLEAFLMASRKAAEFYKLDGRIVTEHALVDDNGDGLGTPADWFKGVRAVRRAKDSAPLDGLFAQQFCLLPSESERKWTPEQRARRDALERAIFLQREKKSQVPEDAYYRELEKLLLEMAAFYHEAER